MAGRYVFDTNVIVSAVLLPKSKPRKAFDQAKGNGKLLVSEEVIEELNDVLRRDDFEKYISESLRVEFLAALQTRLCAQLAVRAGLGHRARHHARPARAQIIFCRHGFAPEKPRPHFRTRPRAQRRDRRT